MPTGDHYPGPMLYWHTNVGRLKTSNKWCPNREQSFYVYIGTPVGTLISHLKYIINKNIFSKYYKSSMF